MIDIESLVFTAISNVLNTYDSNIVVYGEYVETPSSFPCVCVVETDNSESLENSTINRSDELFTNVNYTIDVFTNKAGTKKSDAKAIMEEINVEMHKLGFIRNMRSQTPNIDRTIYRMTARYSGKVHEIADTTNTLYVVNGR